MAKQFNGFGRKHEVDQIIAGPPITSFATAVLAIFVIMCCVGIASIFVTYFKDEPVDIVIRTGADVQLFHQFSPGNFTAVRKSGALVQKGDTIGYIGHYALVDCLLQTEQIARASLNTGFLDVRQIRYLRKQFLNLYADSDILRIVAELAEFNQWDARSLRLLESLKGAIWRWKKDHAVLATIGGVLEYYESCPSNGSFSRSPWAVAIIPLESRLVLTIGTSNCKLIQQLDASESVSIMLGPGRLNKPVEVLGTVVASSAELDSCYLQATFSFQQFYEQDYDVPMPTKALGKIRVNETLFDLMLRHYEGLGR